jgi:tetratricopeptide (TPR) repeat protein
MGQIDKAISLYNQSLEFAIQEKDTSQMITYLSSISVAYSEKKDYTNAQKSIFAVISLDKRGDFVIKSYTNLIDVYMATNEPDSAFILLHSLSERVGEMDDYEFHNYYDYLYRIYAEKGDYKTALDYHEKAMNIYVKIVDDLNEESIQEIDAKYNNEKLKNSYNQTVIEKQRTELTLSIIAMVAMVVAAMLFVLYRRSKDKRKVVEERIDTMESLIEREKETTGNRLSDANRASASLRRKLIEELDLTKKIVYIHSIVLSCEN